MRSMVVIATASLAACGSLVGGDYAGEPLIRLRGVASSSRLDGVTTPGVMGAALWQGVGPAGVVDFTRLPLELEFPAFWIDIPTLPRREAGLQLDPGEPVIAEAYLHIVKPQTAAAPRADDFLATDYAHVLVYVSDVCPPTGVTASYLGGNLAPGFHVMIRTAVGELTAPQQVLVDRCVALATTTPPDRARAACTAQHLYRLAPSPEDLDTILGFHVESPGA